MVIWSYHDACVVFFFIFFVFFLKNVILSSKVVCACFRIQTLSSWNISEVFFLISQQFSRKTNKKFQNNDQLRFLFFIIYQIFIWVSSRDDVNFQIFQKFVYHVFEN